MKFSTENVSCVLLRFLTIGKGVDPQLMREPSFFRKEQFFSLLTMLLKRKEIRCTVQRNRTKCSQISIKHINESR